MKGTIYLLDSLYQKMKGLKYFDYFLDYLCLFCWLDKLFQMNPRRLPYLKIIKRLLHFSRSITYLEYVEISEIRFVLLNWSRLTVSCSWWFFTIIMDGYSSSIFLARMTASTTITTTFKFIFLFFISNQFFFSFFLSFIFAWSKYR